MSMPFSLCRLHNFQTKKPYPLSQTSSVSKFISATVVGHVPVSPGWKTTDDPFVRQVFVEMKRNKKNQLENCFGIVVGVLPHDHINHVINANDDPVDSYHSVFIDCNSMDETAFHIAECFTKPMDRFHFVNPDIGYHIA